jgi:hypothetical protein
LSKYLVWSVHQIFLFVCFSGRHGPGAHPLPARDEYGITTKLIQHHHHQENDPLAGPGPGLRRPDPKGRNDGQLPREYTAQVFKYFFLILYQIQ